MELDPINNPRVRSLVDRYLDGTPSEQAAIEPELVGLAAGRALFRDGRALVGLAGHWPHILVLEAVDLDLGEIGEELASIDGAIAEGLAIRKALGRHPRPVEVDWSDHRADPDDLADDWEPGPGH